MASKYYYRRLEIEAGPVGFRDLVSLVRDGELVADDGVRPEWEEDWQPAASIVGLFHMAKRADALAQWETEQAAKADVAAAAEPAVRDFEPPAENNFDDILSAAEEVPSEAASVPSWQRRLQEIMTLRFLREKDESDAKSQAAISGARLQNAISSAVEALDRNEVNRRPGRIQRGLEVLRSPKVLHGFFRIALALVAANCAAIAAASWSEAEAQRYPSKQQPAVEQRRFPLWGECSEFEYQFLLADVMVVAGALGYCGARLLESMADD